MLILVKYVKAMMEMTKPHLVGCGLRLFGC